MNIDGTNQLANEIHASKHRLHGESFREYCSRVANAMCPEYFDEFRAMLLARKFLPAGRIQYAMGNPQDVTAANCFVSGTIKDSMSGIMQAATEAAETMRKGGGDGFDFSTIRPRGASISTLGASSSGAVSFMKIFDAVCGTIVSAGQRRGAMMGIIRIDHPDIEEFIACKQNTNELTNFNISVAVTDEFMLAVQDDKPFDLVFNGVVYKTVSALALWDRIMRNTYDWAEPGVLFIDTINKQNNLSYCETIAATNPCAEQVLPPNGACILGSFNLTKGVPTQREMYLAVRAMDNVLDVTNFPLEAQAIEAQQKRRIGIGYTGMANYIEHTTNKMYGSSEFLLHVRGLFRILRDGCYGASIDLAKEKGAFHLYTKEYLDTPFIKSLPMYLQHAIAEHGIRNSHLISYAPCGTISLTAGNISSGIEPVFAYEYERTIIQDDSTPATMKITDYAYREQGTHGKTAAECTVDDHLSVLALAQKYCDSSVSKTINVPDIVQWDEFKDIYMKAWSSGNKGVTTFRAAGKRFGVLNEIKGDGAACYYDPVTGVKSCE